MGRSWKICNPYLSLNQIEESYGILLLDSCTIISCFKGNSLKEDNSSSIIHKNGEIRFCNYLKEYFRRGGNIFFREPVVEEIMKPSRNHEYDSNSSSFKRMRKGAKGIQRKMTEKEKRGRSKWIKKSEKRNRKRASLVEMLREEGNILELNSNEEKLYARLSKAYSNLKNTYGLSETDFDILMAGAVVSFTKKPCAILSNDASLCDGWVDFLKDSNLSSNQLGYFYRESFEGFREAKPLV